MRKSYGFRTFRCLELALYHSLGKLPEPESTHEFFCRTFIKKSLTLDV
jgi:transposase